LERLFRSTRQFGAEQMDSSSRTPSGVGCGELAAIEPLCSELSADSPRVMHRELMLTLKRPKDVDLIVVTDSEGQREAFVLDA
jgi:hypothetical protein